MFNLFGNKSLIDKLTLKQLLEDSITPRLEVFDLVRQSDYLWCTPQAEMIRKGFGYCLLKGEQGTFTWGICLDFIPVPYGGKLTYFRTSKNFRFQLFEWTDEYSSSFFGGNMQEGITMHWGLKEAKKSIIKLFERYEAKLCDWFEMAKTVEGLISIAEHQVHIGRQYKLHSPDPRYVLAFLYAKTRDINKAINSFDALDLHIFNSNEELRSKARIRLFELAERDNNENA